MAETTALYVQQCPVHSARLIGLLYRVVGIAQAAVIAGCNMQVGFRPAWPAACVVFARRCLSVPAVVSFLAVWQLSLEFEDSHVDVNAACDVACLRAAWGWGCYLHA